MPRGRGQVSGNAAVGAPSHPRQVQVQQPLKGRIQVCVPLPKQAAGLAQHLRASKTPAGNSARRTPEAARLHPTHAEMPRLHACFCGSSCTMCRYSPAVALQPWTCLLPAAAPGVELLDRAQEARERLVGQPRARPGHPHQHSNTCWSSAFRLSRRTGGRKHHGAIAHPCSAAVSACLKGRVIS